VNVNTTRRDNQCYGTVTARSEYTRVWSKFRKTNKATVFVR